MNTKMKMLESAVVQLRGKALEHLTSIEVLLDNPVGISDHTTFVAEITKHAKAMAECEDAMNIIKTYCFPQATPQPVPAPPPAPSAPVEPATENLAGVSPAQSPTLRRAMEQQQVRKQIEEAQSDEPEEE